MRLNSSKAKAKPSSRKLPPGAKVKRKESAQRRRTGGRNGLARAFFGPIGLFLLAILLVMGVGYWALADKLGKPISRETQASSEEIPPAASQLALSTGTPASKPSRVEPTAPPTTTPKASAPEKAPSEGAETQIVQQRSQIDRSGGARETMLVTVYYGDGLKGGSSLTPVEIRVPNSVSRIRVTAQQVIDAATDLKLYSNVPVGTRIQGVSLNTKTGVATIDLSPEAALVQGSAAAATMQAAFVYSLAAIKEVKAVQLWINGRPAVLHGITWDKPLARAELDQRNQFKVESVIRFGGG